MEGFQRYTFSDAIRSVLKQAVREAALLQHDYLGTGHILLALLREEGGPAARVLTALKVDRDSARARTLETLLPGNQTEPMGERPYTTRARRVLESAMASADEFMESGVDTDNLLIGLVSVEECLAARTLAQAGATAAAVREEARRLRGCGWTSGM